MREQDRVMSVMSEVKARGGRALVETLNPCSNSIEPKRKESYGNLRFLSALCQLKTFFNISLSISPCTLHSSFPCKMFKVFFPVYTHWHMHKAPKLKFFLKKYPAQTFWNCFIFKYSSVSETFKYIISYTVIIHWPVTFKRKMSKCS